MERDQNGSQRGSVTWSWVVGILITLVGALAAAGYSNTLYQIRLCEVRQAEIEADLARYKMEHGAEARQGFERIAHLEADILAMEREIDALRKERSR